jgi:hypothetical protein
MKLQATMVAFLFASAALAACQGGTTYAPQTGAPGDTSQGAMGRAPLPAPFDRIASALPDAAGTCTAPDAKLPGNYISMLADGTAKGTTFTTATGGISSWSLDKYSKAAKPKPTPSPSPGTSPTPNPKTIEVWVYTGTYVTAKTKQTGCATVIASKSGRPLEPGIGSGIGTNSVQFSAPYWKTGNKPLATGLLSETVTGLSASGGKGTAVLTSSKGATYDTATITLTGRTLIKLPVF